ncbi:EcsC family protein [Nodosilinea sp. PGN35]|uniref:EcsC family protein n=1 Tax=Nodosilinea sp. PGN35 TaxID=3020489 RepID=UPI0023B2E331|nr:EcsC family protein [Nodosilinea sp. TSF1-S3]MDF0365193.1 EcsC family protein [Nodosilinea sp. TSF1-S3]
MTTTPPPSADSNDSTRDTFQAVTQVMQAVVAVLDNATASTGNAVVSKFQPFLEPVTATVGQVVGPIANLPFIRYATALPGMKWLLAALGQVNVESVRSQVAELRQQYPQENKRALAQRVMAETALKAAGIGLATNFVPPVAFALTLVDIGAIAALQANMIYRIATIYGYSPTDHDRRGEVLAIWLLSSTTAGMVKSGLSIAELIPGLGAILGVATDTSLIYSVGYFACRYYETKRSAPTEILV